jgi:hypothetical protein
VRCCCCHGFLVDRTAQVHSGSVCEASLNCFEHHAGVFM